MMLRKIVDWIKENQHLKLAENINEFDIENDLLDAKDLDDTCSSRGSTSVLDFFFAQKDKKKNSSVTNQDDTRNTNSNFDSQQKSIMLSKDISIERENENIHKSAFEGKNIICQNRENTLRNSLDCQLNATSTDIANPSTVSSKSSSLVSLPCKTKQLVSEVKCLKSIYTQTEAKVPKRLPSTEKNSSNQAFLINQEEEKINKSPRLGVSRNCKSAFSSKEVQKKIKSPAFSVSRNSAFSSVMKEVTGDNNALLVYGKLFVLGCDKTVPEHLAGKMETKYILNKRNQANGITEAFSHERSGDERECISPAEHVISYPLPNNRFVNVAFKHDSLTDMFQIGRCEEPVVDFKVIDINPSDKARHGVSRYACRILVRRDGNHEARVYAGAFDSTKKIFIGDSGIPTCYRGKMDGFTTNGVLMMHPENNIPGEWREISICGNVYPLRSSQIPYSKRPRLIEESNVLQDYTLIDLCGVTLLWRTAEGLKQAPTEEYLHRLQSTLYRSVPDCNLPKEYSNSLSKVKWIKKKAYSFLSCGHVVGLKLEEPIEDLQGWSCPVCLVISPITEMKIVTEPGFYIDREFPSYAFRPCGHAASEKTIKYWSSAQIPKHRIIQDRYCPFCFVKLNYIKTYVKLILPSLE